MPRKVFQGFSRLDASDLNTYLMDQAVQTFAGTAARGSAITTPVEGMVTYLEDLDRYDTYNGSSHVPMGGLTLVKSQTVGSAVATVTVENAFSADYDNYLVTMQNVSASDASQPLRIQLGATTSGYTVVYQALTYAGASAAFTSTNATRFARAGRTTSATCSLNCNIFQPFLSARTFFQGALIDDVEAGFSVGALPNTTSYTDFIVSAAAGTLSGGTVNVYGYKKA
jgi:hypothetical protein